MIAFMDGDAVDFQSSFTTQQSGNQHQQRALRQMEVGDQSVHAQKYISRTDEDVGFTRAGRKNTIGTGAGFQYAAGGGADAKHPPALRACGI